MIKLRYANEKDFEAYVELYLDEDNHILISKGDDTSEDEEAIEFFGADFLKILEEEYNSNCKFENFKAMLGYKIILVAEIDSEIVGFVSLFSCDRQGYKIDDCILVAPQNEELKEQVIRAVLRFKFPRARRIIVTLLGDEVKEFFEKMGFTKQDLSGFYEFQIPKQRRGN